MLVCEVVVQYLECPVGGGISPNQAGALQVSEWMIGVRHPPLLLLVFSHHGAIQETDCLRCEAVFIIGSHGYRGNNDVIMNSKLLYDQYKEGRKEGRKGGRTDNITQRYGSAVLI